MGFEHPVTVQVPKKDLSRLYHLVEDMKNWSRGPEIDDMDAILRRLLKMDEPRYEPED